MDSLGSIRKVLGPWHEDNQKVWSCKATICIVVPVSTFCKTPREMEHFLFTKSSCGLISFQIVSPETSQGLHEAFRDHWQFCLCRHTIGWALAAFCPVRLACCHSRIGCFRAWHVGGISRPGISQSEKKEPYRKTDCFSCVAPRSGREVITVAWYYSFSLDAVFLSLS